MLAVLGIQLSGYLFGKLMQDGYFKDVKFVFHKTKKQAWLQTAI